MKNKKRRNIDDTLKERTPGEIIAAIRKEHGWTQEELAWHSRISVTQIGRIERNQVMPNFETIEKLEDALGVKLLDHFAEYRKSLRCGKEKQKSSYGTIIDLEYELRKRGLDDFQLKALLHKLLNETEPISEGAIEDNDNRE